MALLEDEYNIIYYVYLMYGFGCLLGFNTILTTLQYFMDSMKHHSPSFFVSFGFNALIVIMLIIIIFTGHKLKFSTKNNLMMFFSSPFLFLLPITCEYIPDDYENTKFFLFLIILMILGFFCAYQQAALYGQASCFPTEK